MTNHNQHTSLRWSGRIFLLLLLSFLSIGSANGADAFRSVERRLIKDGFDPGRIEAIYNDPKISFESRGVSMYFVHREGKLNYDQFLSPSMIQKAGIYMQTHDRIMTAAERNFGVDREVVTAILLVETKLGSYVGNRLVINTFSTMAALSDPSVRERLWDALEKSTSLSKAAFEAKALRKSSWAYDELKSFLVYTKQHDIDPLSVVGSYAGALGYCQFLPSNVLRLGKDGNGDGKLDLFNHADAVMSVASYLKHHGWQPGLSAKKAGTVIYSYNHSQYYVDTVMEIAKKLNGQKTQRPKNSTAKKLNGQKTQRIDR